MAINPNLLRKRLWTVLLTGILLAAVLYLGFYTSPATARLNDSYGPACGSAQIDGVVDMDEWSGAATQTFQLRTYSAVTPLTATFHVMNNAVMLYIGITINDDEYSTIGTYLPHGDGFRIDFDNDHSGTLFAIGDNVLDVSAGFPQFRDSYLSNPTTETALEDVYSGGVANGDGIASRTGGLNHFEIRFPLCSRDHLDFCLHPGDTIGFRLEYNDAQGSVYGSSQFYPDNRDDSIADIVIATCPQDYSIYLPVIQK